MADENVEGTTKNSNIPSITILDSEDEDEQSTDELFEGFIKAVQPFLDRKELLLLRVKFAALRPDFKCSSRFKDMLRRKTNQVHKVDVYIHFNEVLKDLISNAAVYGRNAFRNGQEKELNAERTSSASQTGQTRTASDCSQNGGLAGKFENPDRKRISVNQSSELIDSDVQIIDRDTSLSQSGSSSGEFQNPRSSGLTKEREREKARMKLKRKKHIEKLELKLKYISEEIKRLSQAELSLDEMDYCDSSYIMESRLKKQFNQIWNKICKLKGRPTDTGRVIEGPIKCKRTGFPAIDKAIGKFLKRKQGFPDIFDVRNLIIKVNKKYSLGLTPVVLQDVAADILTDVGNKLQKKRKKDFEYNFGCHLTDDYLPSLDPALNNKSLRQKLDENKRINQNALENVFQTYVRLDRVKGHRKHSSDSDTTSETDSESDDGSYRSRKKKLKKGRNSASESDTEVDHSNCKREKNSTNTGTGKSLIVDANGLTGTSATTISTLSTSNESIQLDSSQDMSVSDKNKDETSLDYVPGTINSTELETANPEINIPTMPNFTESNTEIKAVQPQVNGCGYDGIVEIIDNDQDCVENHGVIMNETESESDGNLHKRKSPINPTKLLSKIQELRNNQLCKFAQSKSSNESSASGNLERAESCHSKRKATQVRHITHNQHQLNNSLSNHFADKQVLNHITEVQRTNCKIQKTEAIPKTSQQSAKTPACSSHITYSPQQKEIPSLKESLKNCPSTIRNNSILQNNRYNETHKHEVNSELRNSSSPEFPVERCRISTASSRFSSDKKLSLPKEIDTVIILSDDDDN